MTDEGEEKPKDVFLDRKKFKERLRLRAVRIPKQHSHFVSKSLSRFTLSKPKLKHVIHDPESSDHRLVLLAEQNAESDELEDKIAKLKTSLPVEIVTHEIELDYKYFSVDQVLKEILPKGCEVPASFETVGHIAHVNLRDDLLPFKKIIADVLLDKNQPRIRSVVNKVGTISNEFRVPTWEVLAGDENLIVLDMFAGIGPFAIPAAQKQCLVLANDLNPASVTYLEANAKINKVAVNVKAYNLDAREFMRDLQKVEKIESTLFEKGEGLKSDSIAGPLVKPWESFHHVVMNLPASAITFLDVFKGLLSRERWRGPMPRVHCYCFMRASETTSDVLQLAESFLGTSIHDPQVWTVRDVAPNKVMLCISFDLPQGIAFREANDCHMPTNPTKNGPVSDLFPSYPPDSSQSKRTKYES